VIDGLILHNFKAFRALRLPVSKLTVLTGANSSGKSTVLQAIGLIRQSLAMYPEGNVVALNGDIVQLGTGRDLRHERWDDSDDIGGDIGVTIEANARVATIRAAYVADSETLSLERNVDALDTMRLLGGRDFQYVRANRMAPATTYERSYRAVVEQHTLGAQGQFAVDFLRTYGDEYEVDAALAGDDRASRSLLSQTEAWLGRISPGTNLDVEPLDGTDTVRLAFQVGRTGLESSNKYRPTNVGFGLAYVLPIIVASLISKPGGILIVENPEAHLHPAGQSAMGYLLAACVRAGTQVIVETHSDHVVNALRISVKRGTLLPTDLGLKFFSRSERGEPNVSSLQVSPDGTLPDWPVGFFDEFGDALVALTSDDG